MDPVLLYDFRHADRIGKDLLHVIRLLHEDFAHSLASSLTAYLRSDVAVNLISVRQLSFAEFIRSLPVPTTVITLDMKPCGHAVLELNPSLVFPLLEMLQGGTINGQSSISREITEIERSVLDGLLRVILHDLESAWTAVAAVEFVVDGFQTEPRLLRALPPTQAGLAISIEMRVGETSGTMNLGIPSAVVKTLRRTFDPLGVARKPESSGDGQERMLRMIQSVSMQLDARLQGPTLGLKALLDLREGDVLELDHPLTRPLDLMVNGKVKFHGGIVAAGSKRALEIHALA